MLRSDAMPRSTRRERRAWYLYDFGNSAYAAVVLLAVYSAYFQGEVVGGAEGSRLWGISLGIAMLTVALISPILGAIADFTAAKKKFLFFFTALSCTFTALLFFVMPGDVFIGMFFFIMAEIGYRAAQVFYNAMLPEIAGPEEVGSISGKGWAIGSAGGILCLVLILGLILAFEGIFIVRLSLVITAAYFALSTIPLFLHLRERAIPLELPAGENLLTIGFRRIAATFRRVRHFGEFIKFLIAFLVYNDGIIMAMDFAAILGAVLFGMNQQQLIIFMIIVQVTSVAGAYLFGMLADRVGSIKPLIISLLLMIVAAFWMYAARSLNTFFLIGALAGFALTGVQSVSRTLISQFSPPGQSAEFYGFFAVAGRTSSFIGPAVFGILAAAAAGMYERRGLEVAAAERLGLQQAVLSIVVFLVLGLILLLFVNEDRARQQARG